MATNEELMRSVSSAFVKTMRQTDLVDKYKAPELLFVFTKKFEQLYSNGVLNLEEIYQEMSSVEDVNVADLQGLFLIFRDQEQTLGLQMQLPAELLMMQAERRERLHARMRSQVEHRLIKASPKPTLGEAVNEEVSLEVQDIRVSSAISTKKVRLVLSAVAVAMLCVSIYVNLFHEPVVVSELVTVTAIDLASLGLSGTLQRKEKIFLLTVEETQWQEMPAALQKSRLEALTTALDSLGVETVVVSSQEKRTLMVSSPQGVFDINRIE